MEIKREISLSKKEFMEKYLIPNMPVIVTDAMIGWDVKRFQPESLKKEFGDEFVQVYDDLFDLQNVKSLEEYFEKNFEKNFDDSSIEYTRWYTKFKEMDFFWSDDVFDTLKESWNTPYFLPTKSFLIPFCENGKKISSNESAFPYKGLFISGKGARTRLHKDPFNSNAILCQLYGQKEIVLYAPDQKEFVTNKNGEFINPKNKKQHENFSKAEYTYKTVLSPKEIIFIPAGWFHDVTSITDSISITWNFVHSSESKNFYNYIKNNPRDPGMETVKYFLKYYLPKDSDVDDICNFINEKFLD